MGLNGPELVEKTCGASMFYNPKTQVCDWPSIVEAIKPQCQGFKFKLVDYII